jgi:hypothetical protein
MNNKRKLKKKKERENKSKAKVLKLREKLRKQSRWEKHKEREDRKMRDRIMPYRKADDPQYQAEEQSKKLLQIEKNLEELKRLEKEFEEEQVERSDLNAVLEADGYSSLGEKMSHLGEVAQKMATEELNKEDENTEK